jgi:superfamily II DNA or RNA helicase
VAASPLRPGETVRIRGERWSVTAPAGPILHVRGCDAANRSAAAAFLLTAERVERLPPCAPRVLRPARWRHVVRGILAGAAPRFDSMRTAARAQLTVLPFQLEPAIAVATGVGVRLLIADEVGLGKTVQAGLIAAELLARTADARVLIVAPAGLREQWQGEIRRRFGIVAAVLDSAALARSTSALAGANPWTTSPVGITSIDFVKRPEVIRSLESMIWDLVVFDEAHALAGRSDRATAARTIAERARILVMLTATPHSGDDAAFARLAATGDIGRRFPLVVFRRTRQDAGLAASRRTTWLRVRPTPAERQLHRALIIYTQAVWSEHRTAQARSAGAITNPAHLAMIVLARRACSSAGALARSVARRLELLAIGGTPALAQLPLPFGDEDDDAADAALGAAGLSDPGKERRILVGLLGLADRAAAEESKASLLRRFLRRARQPAIVFTEYRDTLALLAGALSRFEPVRLHGALTSSERRDAVRRFTRGEARLLLATDAASEGLNLHDRCRLVINLELPWTPLRLEQRVGRVERIGQRRRVHAVHLIAAGTSEEATVYRLLRRLHRVNSAVEAMRAPSLREQDIAAAVFEPETHDRPATSGDAGPASVVGAALDVGAAFRRPEPRLLVPDLRAAATVEAERITQARLLQANRMPTYPERPVVTRLRGGRVPFVSCCAYRLVFADANDEFIWETLVAVASGTRRDPTAPAKALRALLASAEAAFAPRLRQAHDEMLARFLAGRRAPADVAIAREGAILQALHAGHSRMAARLLQRGLFDRRAELTAAAQATVLREAAARCEARLRELQRVEQAVPAGHDLAFAVIAG